MCGIVGYVGEGEAASIVLDSLARLEYRGYDSAGLAVLDAEGRLTLAKDVGKLAVLRAALEGVTPPGGTAIGHTRWATHGKATTVNAHPHTDASGDVVVVHNGIVENHRELRAELAARGRCFRSETDSEVIPHLIAEAIEDGCDLEEATRRAIGRLQGAAAIVAIRRQEPGVLVAARIANAGGIVIGYGRGAMHVASDLPALLEHTHEVAFLEDGEMVRLTGCSAAYSTLDGAIIDKQTRSTGEIAFVAGKNGFEHFMAKEIAEQPAALRTAIAHHAAHGLDDLNLTQREVEQIRRVVLIGMGTSLHSAMIGRGYMERLAGLPSEVDGAAEYRYRQPLLDESTLVIAVAQSGETVDTLAAMHEARDRGARVVAVCNSPGSQATRVAQGTVYMRCGPEVAVASTKTFLGSLTALYLLACRLGALRSVLAGERLETALRDLELLPAAIERALTLEPQVRAVAERLVAAEHLLFVARGLQYPVAMEGALKLKEVSYVHAEGYAAGELKHGPIALIDERMPVVAIAPRDDHYAKMLNNIEEIRARNGVVIAIASEGDEALHEKAQYVLRVPDAPPLLQPLVATVPLQLLAYHLGLLRGCDIDQPRNLAKTVTVE